MVVPVGMPQDTEYNSYFGGAAANGLTASYSMMPPGICADRPIMARRTQPCSRSRSFLARVKEAIPAFGKRPSLPDLGGTIKYDIGTMNFDLDEEDHSPPDPQDLLLEIASRLSPAGCLSAPDADERALRTACALMFFLSEGNTPQTGAFRAHASRMVKFLETVVGLQEPHKAIVARVVQFARDGRMPKIVSPITWEELGEATKVETSPVP